MKFINGQKAWILCFQNPNDEVQQIVSEIVNKYPSFVPEESKDGIWADPYVIALAKAFNAVVVTGEKMVGPGAKTPKIPNICRDLQIQCIDFLELIRRESWRFQNIGDICQHNDIMIPLQKPL